MIIQTEIQFMISKPSESLSLWFHLQDFILFNTSVQQENIQKHAPK